LIWGLRPQTPYTLTRATRLQRRALRQVALRARARASLCSRATSSAWTPGARLASLAFPSHRT